MSRPFATRRRVILVLALALGGASLHAELVSATYDASPNSGFQTGDGFEDVNTHDFAIQCFDPALGRLDQVTLTLRQQWSAHYAYGNAVGSPAGSITWQPTSTITAFLGGTPIADLTVAYTFPPRTQTFPAGSQYRWDWVSHVDETTSTTVIDPGDPNWASYLGPGLHPVATEFDGNPNISGGALFGSFNQRYVLASATLLVDYLYTPLHLAIHSDGATAFLDWTDLGPGWTYSVDATVGPFNPLHWQTLAAGLTGHGWNQAIAPPDTALCYRVRAEHP